MREEKDELGSYRCKRRRWEASRLWQSLCQTHRRLGGSITSRFIYAETKSNKA